MICRASATAIPLGEGTVQCCITSPPYYGLRRYEGEQEVQWSDGMYSAFGLEKSLESYVAHSVEILREIRRVLRDDGVLFLTLGDSYAGSGKGGGGSYQAERPGWSVYDDGAVPNGLKPKDLCLIPFRVALAAQADGWYVRSVVIWAKPNPMPESVTDRPTTAHEYVLLLTKSASYYWDAEGVKERAETTPHASGRLDSNQYGSDCGNRKRMLGIGDAREWAQDGGRNLRSVWTISTQPFPDAHFATYPPKLVRTCILAGTSEKGACPRCGKAWERVIERTSAGKSYATGKSETKRGDGLATAFSGYDDGSPCPTFRTLGWRPGCSCPQASSLKPQPCVVLDPFVGSGTTVMVAEQLGRVAVGLDISQEYCEMATNRVEGKVAWTDQEPVGEGAVQGGLFR